MKCLRRAWILPLLLLPGCASFRHADDPWWGPDKAKHLAGSFAMAAGATLALASETDEANAAAAGVGASMTLGAGKEFYDRNIRRSYISGKDLTWDLIGSLLGSFFGVALSDE